MVVTALSLSSVSVQMNQNAQAAGTATNGQQVQWLGTRVSQKEQEYEQEVDFDDEVSVVGTGQATQELQRIQKKQTESPFKERQVWQALANLEKDSTYPYCIDCYLIFLWLCCFAEQLW